MRLASTHATVQRIWTVELRPQHGRTSSGCPRCSPTATALQAASARSAALAHLARHARTDALPRICAPASAGTRGCHWHPRHRGCAGPVLLALTRDRSGRTWRLADACAACAAATSHTAVVPAHPARPRPGRASRLPDAAPARSAPPSARPNSSAYGKCSPTSQPHSPASPPPPPGCSPCSAPCAPTPAGRSGCPSASCAACGCTAARTVARTGARRLAAPHQHADTPPSQAQLLDAAVLHQASRRTARIRAAQWALRPIPWPSRPPCPPLCGWPHSPWPPTAPPGWVGVSSMLSPASAGSRPAAGGPPRPSGPCPSRDRLAPPSRRRRGPVGAARALSAQRRRHPRGPWVKAARWPVFLAPTILPLRMPGTSFASLLSQRCARPIYIGRTVRMSCSPRRAMASKSLWAIAAKLVG